MCLSWNIKLWQELSLELPQPKHIEKSMNSVALTESLYDQKLIVYAFSTMRANENWIMSQKLST